MTVQYLRTVRWQVLRYVRQHSWLSLLNILSIALGVSVYLATQIANQSANRAFAASVDLVAGKAELEISAPSGRLSETVLPPVRAVPGVPAATPMVEGFGSLPDFRGDYLQVLGIDVFTNAPFALSIHRTSTPAPSIFSVDSDRRDRSRSRKNSSGSIV